jgi:uroporphyrin-III C-methyltransferase/precorrin-2 dehydrogenase/sirohydrochlorin ferrochelatase
MNRLFPIFIDLAGRPCLVIGGGTVGARKARSLLAAGASVTVVSPHLSEELRRRWETGEIRWLSRPYLRGDLDGMTLAFVAVDDPDVAEEVYREAEERGILLNSADSVPHSTFHLPAIATRGDLTVAISTGGKCPALAVEIKERLAAWIDRDVSRFLTALSRLRAKVIARYPGDPERKRSILRSLTRSLRPIVDPPPASRPGPSLPRARKGTVYLVGAGPGDPGLLTRQGQALLETADEVYHDRLVGPGVLALVPPGTRRIAVGKHPGRDRPDTGKLLVRAARSGKAVVRLKGGDPNLFGKGGEEALALLEARVPFEVVPGVSALTAVPAAAGIPITHRGLAREVIVRSGYRDPGEAVSGSTYVYFMTVGRLPEIVEELLAEGLDPSTPSAAIQEGTLPGQKVLLAPLSDLVDRAAREGMRPPALVVVGEVVRFARLREDRGLLEALVSPASSSIEV